MQPPKLPNRCPLSLVFRKLPDGSREWRGYQGRIGRRPRWIAGRVALTAAMKAYHRKASAAANDLAPLPEPKAAPDAGRVTVNYILSRWLVDRRDDAERGELSLSQFGQCQLSAGRVDDVAGHWLAEDWSPDVTRSVYDQLSRAWKSDFAKRAVRHFRDACRHAVDQGWCTHVRYGDKIITRLARQPKGGMRWKLYGPAQVRRILLRIDRLIKVGNRQTRDQLVQFRAMFYLALNGGFGAKECSELKPDQVNVADASLEHVRGKTGAFHRVPLWPETLAALSPAMALRPDDKEMLFRTRQGHAWCRHSPSLKGGRLHQVYHVDNCAALFDQIVTPMKLKVKGQSFYKLKHMSATLADEAGDPHATFALFGHSLPGSKGAYVAVSDERLRKVANHVRQVLLIDPLPT